MAGETGFDTQSQAEKQGGAPPPPPPAAGDAGNSFLTNMLSGLDPLDTESVKQFGVDARQIKDLAVAGPGGGGFALEPGAGQKFIEAVRVYVDDTWPRLKGRVSVITDHPQLGTGDYARAVAKHDVDAMNSEDGTSLVPNLEELERGLNTLVEGIEIAMEKYRASDEASSFRFKVVDSE